MGKVSGMVWLAWQYRKEFCQDCLVFCLPCQTTVKVSSAIYRNIKGPLTLWDTANWGNIHDSIYIQRIF